MRDELTIVERPMQEPEPVRRGRGRRRAREPRRIVVNLTSLIDVTFLLLIYFMVATDFKTHEQIFRMDLPERSAAGHGGDPFMLDQQPLRIAVASTGPDSQQCVIRIDGPYPQPVSFDALFEFMREKRIGSGRDSAREGMFESDHPVIIEPTASTSWEHAMAVFNAVARARYTNINFAKPGSGPGPSPGAS